MRVPDRAGASSGFGALIDPMDSLWRNKVVAAVLLALTLVLINPPDDVLSSNEEYYFGLAELTMSDGAASVTSVLFDSAKYQFLPEAIIGMLIKSVGYEGARQIGSMHNSAHWAIALVSLFSALGFFPPISAVAVVVLHHYVGPDIFAGEWLFDGIEAKTLVYPFTIFSLTAALSRRLKTMAVMAVIATYLHFHLGGYWFAFVMASLLLHDRSIRRLLVPAFTYIILMAPQIIIVAKGRLATPDFSSVDQTIQDNRLSFMFTRIVVERRWAT